MGGVSAVFVVLLVAVVVIGGIVGLIVVLFSVGARQRRQQVAALTTYAAARGLGFRPGDPTLATRFQGTPFGRGSGRVVSNVLEGVHGDRPVVVFEYRWATGSGDHRHRHAVSVIATALPTPVPRLELAPASTLGTFVDAFGGGDHQIGDPRFDAAYRIWTDSPQFAADLLDPELRAWLLPQRPPFFRLHHGDLLVVTPGSLSPQTADRALAFADALLDRVPERVWARAAGRLP